MKTAFVYVWNQGDIVSNLLRILSGLDMWHEGSYAGIEKGQRAGLKLGKTEFFLLLEINWSADTLSGKRWKHTSLHWEKKTCCTPEQKNTREFPEQRLSYKKNQETPGRGKRREAKKHKADLSLALHFVLCEMVHGLSSKLWKLIENIYISMTGGRGSASSV